MAKRLPNSSRGARTSTSGRAARGRGSATIEDPHVQSLAQLFLEHPAWTAAARHLAEGASSNVYFSHRPDERWHLTRQRGRSRLLQGSALDPDLAFRFTPTAIRRLGTTSGDIADFAVVLFDLITERDENLRVGFRVVAPFWRLARRGYVGLLLACGPKLLAYGAAHGVRTLTDVQRLIAGSRDAEPADWERA